jgi:hypothetical protein
MEVKMRFTNTKVRALRFGALLALVALGIILSAPAAFAAQNHCPSGGTPPPGSTVDGGLDVDGVCIIDNVTVNGGITVEAGGHLQMTRSTVNGGILSLPCSELDVNATTLGSGVPTNTTSIVHGGIDIEASDICTGGGNSDVDIFTAQIDGGLSMTGRFPVGSAPYICGNDIQGGVHLNNVTVVPLGLFEGTIGDPDNTFRACPVNRVSGSFHMSNSMGFAVESNIVGGSVLLSQSTLELNGNIIQGSLRCTNGTVILPGEATDPPGNTVHGKNTCQ